MANDSYTQQALAADPQFQGRVRSALSTVAFQILSEDAGTPNHAARLAFARRVIDQLQFTATQTALWLVKRPNLFHGETSYDFQRGSVVTTAPDDAIEAQLAADWNFLAGTGTASTP